jgi:hypothetical protein
MLGVEKDDEKKWWDGVFCHIFSSLLIMEYFGKYNPTRCQYQQQLKEE